jgi:hypothetical protein
MAQLKPKYSLSENVFAPEVFISPSASQNKSQHSLKEDNKIQTTQQHHCHNIQPQSKCSTHVEKLYNVTCDLKTQKVPEVTRMMELADRVIKTTIIYIQFFKENVAVRREI